MKGEYKYRRVVSVRIYPADSWELKDIRMLGLSCGHEILADEYDHYYPPWGHLKRCEECGPKVNAAGRRVKGGAR